MSPSEPNAAADTTAAPEASAPDPLLIATLPSGQKVKRRMLRMRACNEKDAKGKICAGHLKRWYAFTPEVIEQFGKDAEIYRCEHCRTLYLPNEQEIPRSGTLAY